MLEFLKILPQDIFLSRNLVVLWENYLAEILYSIAFSTKLKMTFKKENVSFLIFQMIVCFSEKKSLKTPIFTPQRTLLHKWKKKEHKQLTILRAIVGFFSLFLKIFFKTPISSKNRRKLKIFLPDCIEVSMFLAIFLDCEKLYFVEFVIT